MKSISKSLVVITMMLALATYCVAQGAAPPAPGAGAAAQEEKAFQGSLVKVDTKAHTLTAKGADNKEMTFTYADDTPVMGAEKTIQGLAGKPGAKVKITYRSEAGANHATRIELSE